MIGDKLSLFTNEKKDKINYASKFATPRLSINQDEDVPYDCNENDFSELDCEFNPYNDMIRPSVFSCNQLRISPKRKTLFSY